MDIQLELKRLASLQAQLNEVEDIVKTALLPLESQVNQLKSQLKEAQEVYDNAVSAFKNDLLAYVEETGDMLTDVSEVTFRRRTKWEYDSDEALQWAMENAPDVVKHSLDKRKFDKDCTLLFPGAEQINIPEIALSSKLGHLLIEHEDHDGNK